MLFLNSWIDSVVLYNATILILQLFKNSIDTQGKLKLNLHSLSVSMSELLEYRRECILFVMVGTSVACATTVNKMHGLMIRRKHNTAHYLCLCRFMQKYGSYLVTCVLYFSKSTNSNV
jgi:hypothetical protein